MHKDKQFKNRKPEGKTVNFRHNGTHAANVVLPPPAYTPPLSENTMAAEEHFAFRAACEHEDKDMYNVYPTCAGATFLEDKDEDELKRIDHEIFGSEESEPEEASEDNDSEPEEETLPPLLYDSDDDEERPLKNVLTASLLRIFLEYDDSLKAVAEPINTDIEDPLKQPKLNDDPNLNVTFSDSEEEDLSATDTNTLSFPKYFIPLGWETKLGFHDDIPLDSAVYTIEDVKISIKGPLILATITDHPAYYFLTKSRTNLPGSMTKSSRASTSTRRASSRFTSTSAFSQPRSCTTPATTAAAQARAGLSPRTSLTP